MRRLLQVFIAVTTVLTVASPASASSLHSASADQAFVEMMLYATSMTGFVAAVDDDKWFDWSTDLCSAPLVGNTGRSFNFSNACRRHDFGYRNHGLSGVGRATVDRRFRDNMYHQCDVNHTDFLPPWVACRAAAKLIFEVVDQFGGRFW